MVIPNQMILKFKLREAAKLVELMKLLAMGTSFC